MHQHKESTGVRILGSARGWRRLLPLALLIAAPMLASGQATDSIKPPADLDPARWDQLKVAVERAKLLPPLDGLAGAESYVGSSVSISGNRALVGAPGMAVSGAAVVFVDTGSGWEEEAVLLPSGDGTAIQFGVSVSLNGDRALIGAWNDSEGGLNAGAAFVFDFEGAAWSETAKLRASDGESGDFFGLSVSLDGDRALVGSAADDVFGNASGSAYVFDFDGMSWSESHRLVPADGASEDNFGRAVSLSGDVVLIGALDDDAGLNAGAAYVFRHDGLSWNETAKLFASDGEVGDAFGLAVQLDGNRALISARGDDDAAPDAGAAYIFEFSGAAWIEAAKLTTGSAVANDRLGFSASLSGNRAVIGGQEGRAVVFAFNGAAWDPGIPLVSAVASSADLFGRAVTVSGDRILVGASLRDAVEADTGAAYVFDYDGARWIERAELVPELNPAEDFFALSVSLDGDRALIGAHRDDDNGFDAGAAYVFERDGTGWSLAAKLLASDGAPLDNFGRAVSLSGDYALLGAWNNDQAGENAGAAYLFEFDGTTWVQAAKLLASDGDASDRFGGAVSLFGNRALVGAVNADSALQPDTGAAYLFERQAGVWTQISSIRAPGGDPLDRFGISVSLGNDLALIGASQDDDNGLDAGAAYLFEPAVGRWRISEKLLPIDGEAGAGFGLAVALHGVRALVGAYRDDGPGAAYVFDEDGADWIQSHKFLALNQPQAEQFGWAVDLEADRALIGARFADGATPDAGAAYLYEFDGANWGMAETLVANDGEAFDSFAHSVSLSGGRILVGAYADDDRGIDAGAAYVFERNEPPLARRDEFTTDEDASIAGDVLVDNGFGPDSDPEGDPLTLAFINGASFSPGAFLTLPSGALLSMDVDGTFQYDPNGQFEALGDGAPLTTDSFTYSISDGFDTATALVLIDVIGVDDPPVAVDDLVLLVEDDPATTVIVLANDTDIDGGPISVASVTQPMFGTAAVIASGARVSYTPDPDTCNNGEPFDEFTYTLAPGGSTATVSALVECQNDPPAADPATASTDEDNDTFILLTGTDPENDPLAFLIGSGPSNGSLGSVVVLDETTARVEYVPDPDFFGSDSFTFRTNDGPFNSELATVNITVAPVNDSPTFAGGGDVLEIEDAVYNEPWATAIAAGPSNEVGQAVSFLATVTANPGLFAVDPVVDANGSLVFVPSPDTTGIATVEVVAMDDGGTANGGDDLSTPVPFNIEVIAAADLTIDKSSGSFFADPGGPLTYTIVVSNPGPSDVMQAMVVDDPPARLGNVSWTCAPSGTAACSPSGSVAINELVNLPEGTSVTFTLDATLLDTLNDPITNVANVTTPAGVLELVPANNTDSDTDLVGLFADGMESVEP